VKADGSRKQLIDVAERAAAWNTVYPSFFGAYSRIRIFPGHFAVDEFSIATVVRRTPRS
jgi:hypothetical protein